MLEIDNEGMFYFSFYCDNIHRLIEYRGERLVAFAFKLISRMAETGGFLRNDADGTPMDIKSICSLIGAATVAEGKFVLMALEKQGLIDKVECKGREFYFAKMFFNSRADTLKAKLEAIERVRKIDEAVDVLNSSKAESKAEDEDGR